MAPNAPRVLVVDDEVEITEFLALLLRREGIQVETEFGGWSALPRVQAAPPDLVLSDIRMMNGDGVELLEAIQGMPPPRPAVALMSSYADILLADILARGAVAFVGKPLDAEQLVAALRRALMPAGSRWARPMDPQAAAVPVLSRRFPTARPSPRTDGNDMASSRRGDAPPASMELVVGRGGAFLPMNGELPPADQPLRFHFTFADGIPDLTGSAVCRWTRPVARHGFAAGAGLEIETLEPASRGWVMDLVAAHDPQAYIPVDLLPAAKARAP